MSDLTPDFFANYLKELRARDTVFNDILSHASKEKTGPQMQSVLKGLYTSKYLPAEHQDFPTDTLI